jgi:hypothetical protein
MNASADALNRLPKRRRSMNTPADALNRLSKREEQA